MALPFGKELLPQEIQNIFGVNPNDLRTFSPMAGGDIIVTSTPAGKRIANLADGGRTTSVSTSGPIGPQVSANLSDYLGIAKQMEQFRSEAVQPAISSLQAQIPEVSARFAQQRQQLEAEKQPLQQRYMSIINELKGRETEEVGEAGRIASQELGRRGIPISSAYAQEFIGKRTQPVSRYYGGQITQAGFEQEAGLRDLTNLIANLTGQETEQQRAIRNAIGQLQAGEPSTAVSQALNLLQLQQQAQTSKAELALKQRLAEQEATKINTEVVTAGGRKLLINKQTGSVIQDLGASETTSGGGLDLTALMGILGGGTPNEQKPTSPPANITPKTFQPLSTSNTNRTRTTRFIG